MSYAVDFFKPLETPAAAGGAPMVTAPAVTNIELPIGSATFFTFDVIDAETGPGTPLVAFRAFKGAVDVSAQGTFSPLPGSVIVNTLVAVSWSSSTQTLVDDGQPLTFEVEDFHGNTGSASTTMNIDTNDVLKTLAGHPVSKMSTWEFI